MKLQKILRLSHRHLSYFFAGMLLVYLISGIALNHKDTFNSQYEVKIQTSKIKNLPEKSAINRAVVEAQILDFFGVDKKQFVKFYFPQTGGLKIFLKNGSNIFVDLQTGNAVYENIRRRPIMGSLHRLHYNPGKGWTLFSDVFAVATILIVLSGIFLVRGKNGLFGWGGVELVLGILIPLIFAII